MKSIKVLVATACIAILSAFPVYAEGWVETGDTYHYVDKDGQIAKDTYIDGYYVALNGEYVKETDAALVVNRLYDECIKNPNEYVKVDDSIDKKYIEPIAMAARDYRLFCADKVVCGHGSNGSNYIKWNSSLSTEDAKRKNDEVEAWLSEVALQFVNLKSDEEKVIAINDWVCNNFEYDMSYNNYSILQFKESGVGVCQAYAATFKKLCNKAGVRCDIVAGKANNGSVVDFHAWNRVYIDGNEKYVDSCWNDTGKNHSKYLLMNKEEVGKSHFEQVIY